MNGKRLTYAQRVSRVRGELGRLTEDMAEDYATGKPVNLSAWSALSDARIALFRIESSLIVQEKGASK